MKRKISVLLLILLGFVFISQGLCKEPYVKEPNVSGQFYSANPQKLSSDIDSFLNSVPIEPSDKDIEIILVPHAGYIYSGRIAACAYKAVSKKKYSTAVVIAPSHYADFDGVAIWDKGSFETPLGKIPVDEAFASKLTAASDMIRFVRRAFDREHALEVQLPFLQRTFKDIKIVPLLMGNPKYENCRILAEALDNIVGTRHDVLIVLSTDLSHFHNYDTAKGIDARTINAVKERNPELLWNQCLLRNMEMCGFAGVVTGLLYAERRGLEGPDILMYANSGDVTGDKSRVVGYTSMIFYRGDEKKEESENSSETKGQGDQTVENPEQTSLSLEQRKRLIEIAKTTIIQYVSTGKIPVFEEPDKRLHREEGAFVTIKKNGQLRGCIGNIIGRGPLYETVRNMAVAAASQDPRFRPVTKSELNDLEIEVSVLSLPRRIKDTSEIELGRHGVIVSRGPLHQGVFLPQVADETGWTKEQFLSNLCAHKAGLPSDAWKDPKTTLEIFSAEVFSEQDVYRP